MIVPKRGSSQTSEGGGDRITASFLTEMDGVFEKMAKSNVFIIAVTSNYDLVDPAIIRAGRLDVHISMSLPSFDSRISIITETLKKMPNQLSELDLKRLAEMTGNTSSGDIVNLCREAAMNAIRCSRLHIEKSDFIIKI